MAHNNGMVPRSRGKARSAKASDNQAKFAAAVEAGPSLAEAANMDPAYTAMPLHGLTGAEVTAFVPHRPARPEKSEGGKRFKLVSEYKPAGDQPTAIKELVSGVERAGARPGAAGRHRLGQDLHHGAGDRDDPAPAL